VKHHPKRRKFVSDRINQMPLSGLNRFWYIVNNAERYFTGGGRTRLHDPVSGCRRGIRAGAEWSDRFTANAGLLELREAIACHHSDFAEILAKACGGLGIRDSKEALGFCRNAALPLAKDRGQSQMVCFTGNLVRHERAKPIAG
jgi:hypothetical protein